MIKDSPLVDKDPEMAKGPFQKVLHGAGIGTQNDLVYQKVHYESSLMSLKKDKECKESKWNWNKS